MLTKADFEAFYPIFRNFTPAIVADEYISQANARFTDLEEDAEEARRLYTAHKLTLYAKTALEEGTTPTKSIIANAGQKQSQVASKRVGEVQVSYSTSASSISGASTSFADLPDTYYGLQLLSLIRLQRSSRYIP